MANPICLSLVPVTLTTVVVALVVNVYHPSRKEVPVHGAGPASVKDKETL